MKTKLLYHENSYTFECTAKVVAVEGDEIAIDATIFFPGGGGQMPDRGTISWNNYHNEGAVIALNKRDDVVWHTLDFCRELSLQVTGGQMYPDRARMDFAMENLDKERIANIEEKINQAVEADYPIRVYSLPREKAFAIPDLIRTKINLLPPEIEEIRIVEIVGLDLQADGGTHVNHTKEVGGIKITKTENKGKINKRLEIRLVD